MFRFYLLYLLSTFTKTMRDINSQNRHCALIHTLMFKQGVYDILSYEARMFSAFGSVFI